LGILIAAAAMSLIITAADPIERPKEWEPVLLLTSLLVAVIGLFACIGPARRGLRIQPMDALRES